jgi:hypothetical protein
MAIGYKSIGLKESDYRELAEKKVQLEKLIGKRLDWADFLLLLADLRPLGAIVGYPVAELGDSGEGEEANPEDYEEMPGWVTRADVEEVVRSEADRIIRELKAA